MASTGASLARGVAAADRRKHTKQIGDLFGVSIKTVESYRLQMMRRLNINDVPGLVRFAIRTGLVSAEAEPGKFSAIEADLINCSSSKLSL
ncbi:MAG: LuxR C-terminal-related transcriptional regulator [Chthoniobacterales bacterium]